MRGYSYMLLFAALLYARVNLLIAQDNSLTFSPSTPLCIGETVQMICYVVSPTAQQFNDTVALISFNGSVAANITTINNNTLSGTDTSRYTADASGLSNNASRPGIRLNITDYQASDGATNFSCHGLYTGGVVSPAIISGYPQRLADPAPSFAVVLSQRENSCFTDLAWAPPTSDRPITSYSVFRDSLHIATVSSNTTQYTDNNINVTMYSVVATSCAGNTTVETMSAKLEYYITSLIVSYDKTRGDTLLNWLINRDSSLKSVNPLNYSALFNYTHTQGDNTNSSDLLSATFSLPATETSYNITKYIQPPSFAGEGQIDREIRVCIHITDQCGQAVTEIMICNYSNSVIQSPVRVREPTSVPIVSIVVGVLIFFVILILTGVTILIIVLILKKKKDTRSRSDTQKQELQEPTHIQINKGNKTSKQQPVEEMKMKGLYADLHHTIPKPDTIKRPDPVEETLYSKVQPMDGPNQ